MVRYVVCFQDFLQQTRKFYSAELEGLDFIQNSEAARVHINSWVQKQTQGGRGLTSLKHLQLEYGSRWPPQLTGFKLLLQVDLFCFSDKIKDILGKDAVDSLTKLVLVNAIYFKGNWNKQFDANGTRDTPFKLNKVEKQAGNMSVTWSSSDQSEYEMNLFHLLNLIIIMCS